MSLRGLSLILCLCLFLAACGRLEPMPDWVHAPSEQALERILAGEGLLDGESAEEPGFGIPDYELFALSPEMRVVAEELAMQHRGAVARAEALHRALLSSPMTGGLGMRYSAQHTATAREAFADRRVNCLSFTLMYVAMARHMGLTAEVNDVQIPPSWDLRADETLLLFRHVNAKVMLPFGDQLVIDLEMDLYSPVYDQTVIDDRAVAAQFYNNRGMELVAEKQWRTAFLHLRKALAMDDRQSFIWNNLGTLYKRRGLDEAAETAYLQGLTLAPGDLPLMSNLSSHYEDTGELDKAAYFYQRVREHRNSNPYYLYSKAREALARGDLGEAERYLKDAMDRESKEPRFYNLAAEIYERQALPDKAEAMRRRAERWREEMYL